MLNLILKHFLHFVYSNKENEQTDLNKTVVKIH